MVNSASKNNGEELKPISKVYKDELLALSAQHSNLTAALKIKLADRLELSEATNSMRENLAKQRLDWQLALSNMDKDELKAFGSNAEIRNAKIETKLETEVSALKLADGALKRTDNEIDLIKADLRHVSFEREVLQTILTA